ncbi:MAG: D-tyrosyl-tRNA(Tyr) deacylase [Blastocatellia bacterium]|nr:D-tyrosyl-tRNA(Tyr) deacylase [Blastocatellia bacterium]
MRAVVQRVAKAMVSVDGEVVGKIGSGILLLLGVSSTDNEADADYLLEKILNLRIFRDKQGKMNLSLLDSSGQLLVVSQFTLFGDCRKGRRPSYSSAATPAQAEKLYNYFVEKAKGYGVKTETGRFQAMMDVELINDGPVTLLIDSQKSF